MIIIDQIEEGYNLNASSADDYGCNKYSGGLFLFSSLNGVDFNFSKLNHHVFFEDLEEGSSIHELGIPVNLSSIYEEELDFVEGTGCIKITPN